MLVKQAKALARQWVREEGQYLAGFCGAYIAGSTAPLSEDAALPATSDLDVHVVLDGPSDALKPGKFVYHGVLLEVAYIPRAALASPEVVLGHYHLAGAFRIPGVLLDPSGHLTALQVAVAREYARRPWVRKRCQHAARAVRDRARSLDQAAPLHDQVTACLFAAGITTHVLLVAGLKNPMVRRRYVAVRELLAEYGRLDLHEQLLRLLGGAAMERKRVEQYLDAVTVAFDAAKRAPKTPYRFGSDISDAARPIAIQGSRELIERGLHREAVFCIAATYSRCRHILASDALEMLSQFDEGYRVLFSDLGIGSFPDRRLRCQEIETFLPRLWEVVQAVLAANPAIEG